VVLEQAQRDVELAWLARVERLARGPDRAPVGQGRSYALGELVALDRGALRGRPLRALRGQAHEPRAGPGRLALVLAVAREQDLGVERVGRARAGRVYHLAVRVT